MADLKKLSFQIPIAIVCLVLAFAITWQLKGVTKIKFTESNAAASRIESMQTEIRDVRQKNDELTMQLLDYKDEIEKYRLEAAKSSDSSKILAEQLAKAEMLAGLTDVEGEGIIVTLTDNTVSNKTEDGLAVNPNWGIIHDDMILRVINELRASGAEAISLNDERILSTTEIRCTGPTVTVNKNRYNVPFIIKAIGNADIFENSLKMKDGVKDYIELWGGSINIKKSTKLAIKRYVGAYTTQYANPVKKEGAE